jgi:hypothetical protein
MLLDWLQMSKSGTSAATVAENAAVIAAVNRCATQKQLQDQIFPQPI